MHLAPWFGHCPPVVELSMRTHVFPVITAAQYRAALAQPFPIPVGQQAYSFPYDLLTLWHNISWGKSNNIAAWFNINRNSFI
jgi:hypothetical protein